MFARRIINQTIKASNAARKMSTYTPKTFRQVWLGDAGAYPIMGLIAFYLSMASFAAIYIPTHTQDLRLTDNSRKSLFRGELRGSDKENLHHE